MSASTLFPGEKVFHEADLMSYASKGTTSSDGKNRFPYTEAGGDIRILSAHPRPVGHDASSYSRLFGDVYVDIPQNDWDAMIDEQIALLARTSDYCDFPAFDQDGLPTCWAIGTCQSMSINRRIMGLPHVQISGCSVAVPISGGHRGGWEGDAVEYLAKHGGCSVAVWPENDTSRSLISDPAVLADRKLHIALEFLEMRTKANWVSACLRTKTGPFAYNHMRHVMAMCDVVRIEAGYYGFRVRNTWHDSWGVKNRHGYGGFATYSVTPDSGYIINQTLATEK